jgi:hypothetical protein
MPVIRSGDEDDVQIAWPQHLTIVRKRSRPLPAALPAGDNPGGVIQHPRIDIAQGGNFHRGDLNEPQQVTFSVPATADEPHSRGPSRLLSRLLSMRRRRHKAGRAGAKKIASVHDIISL